MYERHENEQYFFDKPTLDHLSEMLLPHRAVCVLCAPLLGRAIVERGHPATILDIDERFADVQGYQRYDIFRPHHLDTQFDVVFCDPPFFNASLSQVFRAIRMLAHHDWSQRIGLTYLARRETAVLGTFARFGLKGTEYFPTYQTLQNREKNLIRLYANFDAGGVENVPG